MSEWRTDIREGYRTKEIRIGNAVVTLHRPILSKEEQKRVEDQVRTSMIGLIAEKNKTEKGEKTA